MNVNQKLKMTKENYEKILDMWKNKENRNVKAIYHHSYISVNELFDYAYKQNIVIETKTNDTPFVTISFKNELIEI